MQLENGGQLKRILNIVVFQHIIYHQQTARGIYFYSLQIIIAIGTNNNIW
jgi:hypothetical protein